MNWYRILLAYEKEDYIQKLSLENPYPFKEWFDDSGRSYIPFSPSGTESKEGVDKWVEKELAEKGYQITDYRKGYCAKGNRVSRIGKLLNSLKQQALNEIQNKFQNINQEQDPVKYQIFQNQMQEELKRSDEYYNELIETFTNSSYRANQSNQDSGFMVVISQNPHDVAQMSTGRNWTSCMNLGGEGEEEGSHHEAIFCEVQKGGIVAYLIRSDDQQIEDPLARIHIRRFDNKSGQSVAIPEKSVYGNEIKGFAESVKSWLDQKQGEISPGPYKRQGGEWSDTFGENMLIAPTNIDDVLKWLRGEGEDAQYSKWSVYDNLYDELKEASEYGHDYDEFDMENNSKDFRTKEEADKYLEKMNSYRTEMEEYYREKLAEMEGDSNWTDIDEDTGEWYEPRYYTQEHKTDHRSNMTDVAIRKILKAPKGTYSPEVLAEVKQIVFYGNTRNDNIRKEFFAAYPELFSGDEIAKMKDTDQLDIFKKLAPEEQDRQRQQWSEYINESLDNPDVYINDEVQKRMRERDMSTDVRDRAQSDDSVGLMYTVALEDWLFSPLKEIFKPIPEPIIQKLVNFGMNFASEDNNFAPYKNQPKYDKQILSRIITTLSQTKSDTPTVQNFYKQMLPLWIDNRHTYYDNWSDICIESLGRAIGDLGENGRDFLPFIDKKIEEEKIAWQQLDQSISPEKKEWETYKDLSKRAYKKLERLYSIKQSIDPSYDESMRYRWSKSKNWYKKAQIEEGLDRINSDSWVGKETIGEWLTRHKIQQDPEGKFIFYHGTPREGGATDTLRAGSLLEETPEYANLFARKDRGLNPEDIIVYTLHLSPDDIDGGQWASLRRPVNIG